MNFYIVRYCLDYIYFSIFFLSILLSIIMLTYSRRVFHENSFKLFFCVFLFFTLLAFARWSSFIIPAETFRHYLYISFLLYSLSQINLLFFSHKTGFLRYCLAVVLPAGIIALLLTSAGV
ncbi:MAG: hypothetical protein R6U31_07155, partial [bacterium]